MAVDHNNGQIDHMVPENYENLLEDYSHFAPPATDEVLQGTVLGITAKDVIIDFGYKSEGIVPIEQFQTRSGEITVQIGDVVDVMIEHGEQPEGYVQLSHTRAARLRIWDNLEKAQNDQLVLSGRVLGRVIGRSMGRPRLRGSRGRRWREPRSGRRAVRTAPAGSVPERPGPVRAALR